MPDMKKTKDNIQTSDVLLSKLHSVMTSGLTDFIKTTHAQRIAVRASIRYAIVSVLFIVATAVFLFLAQVNFDTLIGQVIAMTALLWVSVMLISGRSWFVSSSLLAREINMALVPILSDTFNRTFLYTYNESATDSVLEMLNDSSLLIHDIKNISVKNVYTVFGENDMRVHEVMIEQNENDDSKVTRSYAAFIDVNIDAETASEAIVSTTGSSFGFSHDSFVSNVQSSTGMIDVPLEDSGHADIKYFGPSGLFEKEFFGAIQRWCDEAKVNIRVTQKGTKLYILVPTSKESTTYTSTSTKQEVIERYAYRIARPIWRALMVAEEVSKK
jgi:hypothetical protein